jgi:metalloendopeptidase OMA1, mitochondrial
MNRFAKFYGLFVLIATVLLQAGCTTNPYTQRSQLIMDEALAEQEGLAAFREEVQKAAINGNIVEVPHVRQVAERMIAAAKHSKYAVVANAAQWELVVIKNEEPNACVYSGGKIVVNTGLAKVAPNEAAVAAVIGHELTHALARHGAERKSQKSLVGLGMLGAGIAMGVTGVNPVAQRQIFTAADIATKYGLLLPYSREHESEADYIGMLLAAQAGYDPQEAVRVWQRFEMLGDPQKPEFLSTHPSHGTRIHQLQQWMPEALAYYRDALAAQKALAQSMPGFDNMKPVSKKRYRKASYRSTRHTR